MPSLTTRNLAAQQQSYARDGANTATRSHTVQVIKEEQLHENLSRLGLEKGYDIFQNEHHSYSMDTANEDTERTRTPPGAEPDVISAPLKGVGRTKRGDATQNTHSHAAVAEHDTLLSELGTSIVPHYRFRGGAGEQHGERGIAEASNASPLERFLTLGVSTDPPYIRRRAMIQSQYYCDMNSVEDRTDQAQQSARRVVRERNIHRGSTREFR